MRKEDEERGKGEEEEGIRGWGAGGGKGSVGGELGQRKEGYQERLVYACA